MAHLPSSIAANDSKTEDGSKRGSVGHWFKRKLEYLLRRFKPQSVESSDRKEIEKEILGVASRFTQSLLKRPPNLVNSNPIQAALCFAAIIMDIKLVNQHLHMSIICLLSYQTVVDNKDKIEDLKETAKKLLALKQMLNGDVPNVAEQALKKFEEYVFLCATMGIS
jgi:hypothetical protein